MSELKAIESATAVIENVYLVYRKAEADKVIAELKEENEKLKATPEQIMKEVFDKCLIYPKEMVRLDDAYKLAVSLRKQKHKRCLGMVMDGKVIARFPLCLGCKKEMEETYKNVLNEPLTAQ